MLTFMSCTERLETKIGRFEIILASKSTITISLILGAKPHRYWVLERKKRNGRIRAEMEVKPAGAGG